MSLLTLEHSGLTIAQIDAIQERMYLEYIKEAQFKAMNPRPEPEPDVIYIRTAYPDVICLSPMK
jgi:hypothetical protein